MISLRKKIGYGLGDMGLSISYFTVSIFFLYYLTDIVGLAPYLAGLAYFIGQAWNCVNYPLMGVISDRTVSRYGRKRVYLYFGAVPFAVTFILMWLIPLDASQALKFAFATGAIVLYTTLYTMVLVPYVALVPVMSSDYDERTHILAIRTILSTVGSLLGGAAALVVSSFDSELTGLRVMSLVFAAWLFITVSAAARSVRGMEPAVSDERRPRGDSWRSQLGLLRDRNVAILMLFKFLGAVATGSLMASLPYFAKHILGDEGRSTIGLAFYITVSAICVPIWNRLSHRYDKRRLLLGAMAGLALILLAIGLLVSRQVIPAFYLGCACLGTVMSSYTLIAYSLPADLVDYYDHRTGQRPESLIFGWYLTAHQFGVAVAGLVLGAFLQIFGYNGALAEQAPAALMAVRLALGVLPGVAMLLAVGVLQSYTITRQVYGEIRQALERRDLPAAEEAAGRV
jgi:GPH family glycoside/pentoside/hexuronide:cation symporter